MSKADQVFEALARDWQSMDDLTLITAWQPHTIRAAISTGAKKRGVTIQRYRAQGVTSYRVKPEGEAGA